MSITKLQLGIAGAIAVAGTTGYVVQANTAARLRQEAAALRQENTAIGPLQAENVRLARTAADVAGMRNDDAEFRRLQDEAAVLRTRLQQVARAEEARAAAARSKAGQVYDISALDQTPQAKFMARPQYPFEMRQAGTRGEVVVDFLVDANGDVQNAFAARSSQREFEAAALQAVSKWKFNPGRKGGREVVTHMQVPIVFAISGEPPMAAPSLVGPKATEPAFTVEANGRTEKPADGQTAPTK